MISSQNGLHLTPDMVDGINPATSTERHRFHFLDALRGVAAIVVMMRHAPTAFSRLVAIHNSYLAVDFFFCLSGFVIAFSYESRLQHLMSFRSFSASRIIRLWPVALLGAFLGALELLLGRYIPGYQHSYRPPGSILVQLICGLFLLPNISLHHFKYLVFPLDLVTWTLFAEVFANFVYAALVRMRAAANWMVVLITSVSLAALAVERRMYGSMNLGHRTEGFHVGMTRVFFSFFLGILLFRIYKRRTPGILGGWHSVIAGPLLVALFIACLCDPIHKTYTGLCDLFIVAALFPLIIYYGSRIVLAPRWTAICAFFGTISYPLYILHPPLYWILNRDNFLILAETHPNQAVFVMFASVPIVVFLAWATDRYYDSPVRKMLTNKYQVHLKPVLA